MPSIVSEMIQLHICRPAGNGGYEHLALHRASDETVYPDVWQAVTGTLHDGESAASAARREMKEETGLVCRELFVLPYVATFYSPTTDRVHLVPVFGAIVPANAAVTLSSEHQDFAWLDAEAAVERYPFPSHREGLRTFIAYVLSERHSDILRTV